MTQEAFDLSAFDGLDESVAKVFQDPAVQERLARFAEAQKAPLVANKTEVLGKYTALKKSVDDLGGFEQIKTLAQQAAEAKAAADAAALKSNDVEAVRKQAQTEIEALRGKLSAIEQRELAAKTASAVSKAIREAEGISELLEPHVRSRVKSTIDENGNVTLTVVNSDGTEMLTDGVKKATVKDLVAELKTNPTFQPAFKTSTVSGSGAKGGDAALTGMANPFLAATVNYSEQARIAMTNPALAKALAAQAGKTLTI